ncbi:hypothetical protein [Lentzea sp. NPDC059081]|uniref:hypothetical protein n=1 Tax=Lentzea sp. NPDC059081 TaxID=3346719 RepID=UPI0036A199FC
MRSTRTSRAALAGLLAAGAVVASATSAVAVAEETSNTLRITYTCTEPPWPGSASSSYDVTVTAPLTARRGQQFALTASLLSVSPSPGDVPAGALQGFTNLLVGGSGTGTTTAKGLTNAKDVKKGDLVLLSGGKALYTPTKLGVHTFTPDKFQLTTHQDTTIVCVPDKSGVIVAVPVSEPI